MNIVVFASDAKGLSSLNNVIQQAANNNHNVFGYICQDTQLHHPKLNKDRYKAITNVSSNEKVFSDSLGIDLPSTPDWLIVARERWSPESEIISEFKTKFNSKVGLVEPNAAAINSIYQFLESESKNRFVSNIDVFFDHSNFIANQRRKLGFKGNLVVTGNPKYDINLNIDQTTESTLKEKYRIDPEKKQVLFFTLQNKFRYQLFDKFKSYIDQNPDYQYFVKPYPGEPFSEFRNEYYPQFFINGVTPIVDEVDIWGMYNLCDIHIGCFSSVMYPSYLLDKEVIEYSKEIGAQNNLHSNSDIINSRGGHEDRLSLWLSTFNLNLEEFKELTSEEKMLKTMEDNETLWKELNSFLVNSNNIVKLYDEYSDGKAANRIIKFIEENGL